MVAKRSDEERRHWTSVGPNDKSLPLKEMYGVVSETAPTFLEEIASGDERAVKSARRVIRMLADSLQPHQLALVLHMMFENAAENMEHKLKQE